ncbi:amino acid ABC transporter substrate-binding protein [Alsobacter soli]|uniref:Amino acid ABC transporter substrate-binding protein n=1 Tax=Alsobacter soli TaxID=2109933 RepID=A0A2T1HRP3_9HYPH|nr:amino acid ABC transporter substrate-binding protein [Alsobacter soli]
MSTLRKALSAALVAAAGLWMGAGSAWAQVSSPTLDAVKKRGQLICGIDTGIPGYAYQDSSGEWQGLDVSLCRAIADAVVGSPKKVKYIGLTSKERFSVLKSGEIDVLIRDSEHSFLRNTALGLELPAVNFFTGQTFMVRKNLGVGHLKELNGATICVLTGTTLETNIADYNRANGIEIKTLLFEKPEEAFAAADSGRCDGYTDDGGSVAAARSTMKTPADWIFIPETIGGLQPIGPLTRGGDEAWTRLVRWVHYSMLEAEVLGITKANADQMAQNPSNPDVRRFFGLEGDFGKLLGVDNEWAKRIVKDIGNYGEVYEASFGAKGLGLPRGMNNLYDKGGLQTLPTWH